MGVRERLKEYLKFKKISILAFEKSCNLSNGYVKSISKGIGEERLAIILEKYPDLNKNWLIFGDGNMLKDELCDISIVELKNTVEFYKNLAESRLQQINLLQDRLDELTEMLKTYRKIG